MRLLRWLRQSLGGGPPTDRPAAVRGRNIPGHDSVTPLFREAVTRHTQGDLDGAEKIYRTILAKDPDFVPGLHLLGRVHGEREAFGEAEAFLRRARSLLPDDVDILADLADVRRLMGSPDEAKRLLETALRLDPSRAALHFGLARLHLKSGDIGKAIVHLQRTIELDSTNADALNDLGAAWLETGRYDKARHSLECAVKNNPSSPVAYRNLANLHVRLGDPRNSAECFRQALDRSPQDHELRMQLADALHLSGNSVAAMEEFRTVAEQNPGNALAWRRLAETAAESGRRKDAIAWYRRTLDAEPRQPGALNNLGILLSDDGQYEEAAKVLEQAVRIQPDFETSLHNLGGIYHLQNRHEESVDAYKRALEIDSLNKLTLSNFIAVTNYRHQGDSSLVNELHSSFRCSLAPERARATIKHEKYVLNGRRLRVGYLSPDFRRHSVAYFIEPLIEGHDRGRFEVYCYSDVTKPDSVTERLRALTEHWRDVSSNSDEKLAERIREDQIDLLVDLAGHTAGNRLPVFAQKPAPVQLAYLGYPATTGLPELDYRLTDGIADPPQAAEREYSETLVRLPHTFLCYRPPHSAPQVAPFDPGDGTVTFGSFNELRKVSPELIQCWCRILDGARGSKLLLKATPLVDSGTRARVERCFEAAGISSHRIELLGHTATVEEHLALYARVDVALDTFPYNGTTTTCEALYMGVPVVTLAGKAHAGRVGASLLTSLQLPELVAASEDEYVGKAITLAADQEQRKSYVDTLRSRILASPLCDAQSFVEAMETSYLRCWDHWQNADVKVHEKISMPLEVAGAIDLETRNGSRMVLPDDLDQLTTYVLLEQEDWFEDETTFLRKFLSPGMRVLDVGANFGVYTLLAAQSVGPNGRVYSVEPASTTARWLRANVALNNFGNVEIFEHALSDKSGELRLSSQAGSECNRLVDDTSQFQRGELVKVLRLDEFAHKCGIESVDFVKLDAEGAEKQIIDGGRRFLDQESPLVMFEIKSGQDIDLDLVRKFSDLGYEPLRLVPGLGLLAPVDLSQPLDPYSLNLFACESERRNTLHQRGLAAEEGVDQATARQAAEAEVWNYLGSRDYARSLVDGWKSRIGSKRSKFETQWMRMLGHFVAAADVNSAPTTRLASLEAAFELVAGAGSEIGPAARLSSLARIAWALGYRSQAAEALSALVDLGDQGEAAFDWPFLPASPHFDSVDPGEELDAWCQACALDQFECLRTFSSYFLNEEGRQSLERLKGNPFQRPELERRRLLVRLRHGMPLGDVSRAVRVKSAENRNPDFWSRRVGKE